MSKKDINNKNNNSKDRERKYTVIVEDKYGNILTAEQIKEKVIDNDLFYINLEKIKKRIYGK